MIILFGPQGSGKGTQAELLASNNHWLWLSTGQMFRDSKDPEIHKRLDAGELIDDDLTTKVLDNALTEIHIDTEVILDGYPRNAKQARWILDNMSKHSRTLSCIIEIDIPKSESVKRLLARGRSDDTEQAIERRLNIYENETKPIIDLYLSHHIPYAKVNGLGSVQEVQARIQDAITKCVQK